MSFSVLTTILSLTSLLPLLFLIIQHHYKTPRIKFGPPTYPIIGCIISFYHNRRRLLHWYTDLLSISPSNTIVITRLGSCRTIITANPQNVEYILKSNFHNYPKGHKFTEILGDFLGTGIFNADGKLWSSQRKLASHDFSAKTLKEFVFKVLEDEIENRLIPYLISTAKTGQVIDFQELMTRLGFDIICRVSLGFDPDCLDLSNPPPPLLVSFDNAAASSAIRGAAPIQIIWKIKKLLNMGTERNLRDSVGAIHVSINEIIQKRKREKLAGGDRNDLLSRMLDAGMDDDMARDMAISFLMAGKDTTSAALTWLFWLLTCHRDVETGIVRELSSASAEKKKNMDFEDIKNMDFLKACLCETMRLYPPVAWDSKHAGDRDLLPDGTVVYKGDRVTYFPYGMGRMEELWGKDRLEFRPDRWFVEPNGGEMKKVSPYVYPIFQAGPRVCLGKEMAFIQMKYVAASILRRFEVFPAAAQKKIPIFVPLLTAHMLGGFQVNICEKEQPLV
ncbi:cytochrome P450 94B3 [Impatiens glandulifera]|uniref:cytochrome P450 94B3 n=1 Tax=Impatiens glandulifera TaxID=253017 RepID=UPI001FB17C88|nr:cytochrome P450 94B3 [Impatiens glandulifera]